MGLVLARLDAVGVANKVLHDLWKEVLEERKDEELTTLRKFEAQLGFETDNAPEELIEHLSAVSSDEGAEAAEEIAPVCAGDNSGQAFPRIFEFARSSGTDGRIERSRGPFHPRSGAWRAGPRNPGCGVASWLRKRDAPGGSARARLRPRR